jgi:hypothetical protein
MNQKLLDRLKEDPEALKALRTETKRLLSERTIELYTPYPKQEAFHAHGASMRERLLMAANQVGKGGLATDRVLTPTGWTTYGDLKPGDRVIGGDGKPCNVTGVFPRGILPRVALTFDYGSVIAVDPDHLWRTQTPRARWKTITSTRRHPDGTRYGVAVPNRNHGRWTVERTQDMRAPLRRPALAGRAPHHATLRHRGVRPPTGADRPLPAGRDPGQRRPDPGAGGVFQRRRADPGGVGAALPDGGGVRYLSRYDYALGPRVRRDEPTAEALENSV